MLFSLLISLNLWPGETFASGAFSTRFVNKNFSYSYKDNNRKSFRNEAQGRRYFASKDQAFYAHLASVLPKIDRVFGRARKKKIPVSSYDLTLPTLSLPRIRDVARVSSSAFPLNLAVQLPNPRGTAILELSFRSAPRGGDLKWLVSAVRRALASRKGDSGATPIQIPESYPAVCKFTGVFGLYVGANVKTDPETHSSLRGVFQAELQRLLPALARQFTDRSSLKQLGVSGLLPVEPLVQQRRLPDPCSAFNPHGPLVDGANPKLVRTSGTKGSMIAIAMIAPRAYQWGTFNLRLRKVLGELLLVKNHQRARLEQNYLLLEDRGNTERYPPLSEMEEVRELRFQKLLSRIILDRAESSGMREEAVRILVKFDPPAPYQTLIRLLARAKKLESHDGALAVAVRALSAYPEKRAIDLLIRIRDNKRVDWNLRNDCKDTLEKIAAALRKDHPQRRRIRSLKEL